MSDLDDYLAECYHSSIGEQLEEAQEELKVLKKEVKGWRSVFGHLGTPDQVGNMWLELADELREVKQRLSKYEDTK